MQYPTTRRDESVVDDYHGTRIADPYRWLEDPNSGETQAWISAQNEVTSAYLDALPGRDTFAARLTALWDYPKRSLPWRVGPRWFQSRNTGLQSQAVLYWADSAEAADDEWHELLDPNTLSADGTVALGPIAVSEDGRYLAYALAEAGSDWHVWRVREVATATDLDDRLEWSKFSGASWTHDGQGFFYAAYDPPEPGQELVAANRNQKLYYHRLGTPQSEDALVYARPDQPDWGFGGQVTDDGAYLIIGVWEGTQPVNAVFYRDLRLADAPVVELLGAWDGQWSFVDNEGGRLWFQTTAGAPRGQLLEIDLDRPTERRVLVAEGPDNLEGVSRVGDRFFLHYLRDAHTHIACAALDGTTLAPVELPGLGTAGGFGGRREDTVTYYAYTSYTTPGTHYRLDLASGQATPIWAPALDFDPSEYDTVQVFYASADGTRIPLFITGRRDVLGAGPAPTYLYGYGGFNISLTPGFALSMVPWLEQGGLYAVANLRGGGEYGQAWHDAGRRANKQNVFDDFIAAAEYLQAEGYTTPAQTTIAGGSNGGLLVGACLTQRPELYGCALPAVGVLDMLRFHLWTIGWAWASDYGRSDVPEEFAWLVAYSPLHRLTPGTAYPPTLVITSDHDDRVAPAHSFKFAAALQAAQAGAAPTLIRIETRAGHGAGKPTAKVIAEAADRLAFAWAATSGAG